MEALLDKGNVAVISGSVNGSAGTAAVLTTRDGAATFTRSDAGNYTISFVHAFNSTPVVVANVVDATFATTVSHTIVLNTVSTASAIFNCATLTQAAGTDAQDLAALADMDFHFVAIGTRNR